MEGFAPNYAGDCLGGTTKGPATEVCRPCYLHKSNWRVREVETSGRRVFLGEHYRLELPYICVLALYKVSWKTGICLKKQRLLVF